MMQSVSRQGLERLVHIGLEALIGNHARGTQGLDTSLRSSRSKSLDDMPVAALDEGVSMHCIAMVF